MYCGAVAIPSSVPSRNPVTIAYSSLKVKKARGRSKPLSVADVKRLKDEYATSVVPLRGLAAEAGRLEKRVSDLVNAAYGLTPAEVALLWETAPPRTPAAR